jgi:bacteriorhodopsin
VWRWVELPKFQNVRAAVHDVEKQLLDVGLERLVLLDQLSILVLKICRGVGVWTIAVKVGRSLLRWYYFSVCMCACVCVRVGVTVCE